MPLLYTYDELNQTCPFYAKQLVFELNHLDFLRVCIFGFALCDFDNLFNPPMLLREEMEFV